MGSYSSKQPPRLHFNTELKIPQGGGAIDIVAITGNVVDALATNGKDVKSMTMSVSDDLPLIELYLGFPFMTKDIRGKVKELLAIYYNNTRIEENYQLRQIILDGKIGKR